MSVPPCIVPNETNQKKKYNAIAKKTKKGYALKEARYTQRQEVQQEHLFVQRG